MSTAADQGQEAVDKLKKGISESPDLTEPLKSIGFNIDNMTFTVKGKKIVVESRTKVTPELIKQLTKNGGPLPTGEYIDIKYENKEIVGWRDTESATNPMQKIGESKSPTSVQTNALQEKNAECLFREFRRILIKVKSQILT